MAAPLGFKTFTVGEVLSAADVNGYLMHGVLVFATTAARDAAITSPQEGQFAFTKDTNSLFYYDGAAWVASGATGDIEGVTAGVGISGGGTSGTVTVTNSMATAIDAKGDLVVGTGADTFSRLAVGTNTYTLVADSGEATGLKWAAPAGGGKVLQVVSAENATNFSTTSTTPQATGLTVSITPTSATSKVLVLLSQAFQVYSSGNEANGLVSLLRGATIIADNVPNAYIGYRAINSTDVIGTCSYVVNYLDAPATTSTQTYNTKIATQNASTMTAYAQPSGLRSTIVLMEIGA